MNSSAQTNYRNDTHYQVANTFNSNSNPIKPSEAYLSEVHLIAGACLPKSEEALIWQSIRENQNHLNKTNPSRLQNRAQVHPLFIWPVRAKQGFNDYGYFTVQNLVDHNLANPNQLRDYNCGTRTYDFQGGNHQGTDIILWPYPWRRMDEQVMEIVAAAPGTIISKIDGNLDRRCLNNGSGLANSIFVEHADGSIAWYLHFKSGSLTTKVVGDQVSAGEYLGTAGSSGSSDWPHVHFQVFDANGNLIDPWDGTCNSLNAGDTWWQNQLPYDVPSVNRICTKKTINDYYVCPNPEITFEADTFNIGDSLCLWAYTRDMALNSVFQINLYNPSNQNALNWSFTVPWATSPTSYVRWFYVVTNWWTQGWWKFEIVYNGNTYQHMFYMTGSAVGITENQQQQPQVLQHGDELIFNHVSNKQLSVYDIAGKKIWDGKTLNSNNKSINTATWANGMYSIKITDHQSTAVKKVIIQH
jgi:murein DD-endopeptidase MepM/ murein hydrolase activator NlpD